MANARSMQAEVAERLGRNIGLAMAGRLAIARREAIVAGETGWKDAEKVAIGFHGSYMRHATDMFIQSERRRIAGDEAGEADARDSNVRAAGIATEWRHVAELAAAMGKGRRRKATA